MTSTVYCRDSEECLPLHQSLRREQGRGARLVHAHGIAVVAIQLGPAS